MAALASCTFSNKAALLFRDLLTIQGKKKQTNPKHYHTCPPLSLQLRPKPCQLAG